MFVSDGRCADTLLIKCPSSAPLTLHYKLSPSIYLISPSISTSHTPLQRHTLHNNLSPSIATHARSSNSEACATGCQRWEHVLRSADCMLPLSYFERLDPKLDSGGEQGASNGVSPKQFHNSCIGIARGRRCHWRAAPGGAMLRHRARRFGRMFGVAHADRYCLALTDEEQPVPAESRRRHAGSPQRVPEGACKRCTSLGRGPQSYQQNSAVVRAETCVERAIPCRPHL